MHIRQKKCETLQSISVTLEVLMTSLKPLKSKGNAGLYENHNLEIGALSLETAYCTGVAAVCVGTNFLCFSVSFIYSFMEAFSSTLPPFYVKKDQDSSLVKDFF